MEIGISIEISDWLRGLGLEQYIQAFRDNAIDIETRLRQVSLLTY
jgi:hypothetical protein